jgi:hypothetical protein
LASPITVDDDGKLDETVASPDTFKEDDDDDDYNVGTRGSSKLPQLLP